jgi:hypothetical protein
VARARGKKISEVLPYRAPEPADEAAPKAPAEQAPEPETGSEATS